MCPHEASSGHNERSCAVCGREHEPACAAGPAPHADPLVGTIVSQRYEIIRLVGQGGMSSVYKARHMLMDRLVALKVLLPHLVANQQSLGRFQQEAKAASALDHPHIIKVLDFGVSEAGQPFLVMDFLEGLSLADEIEKSHRLAPERVCHVFAQACQALAHAHANGVIHRDIKPSNIMLTTAGGDADFVKIVDFGIAKLLPQDGKEVMQLTQTGEVFGSPLYMSPEQCTGQAPDARSDLFSLACVMYESLCGVPPFLGDNILDTMYKRVSVDALKFAEVDPHLDVPPALEAIVRKALARERDSRFSSMDEFGAAIALFEQGATGELEACTRVYQKESMDKPPDEPGRRSRWERAAAATLLVIVLSFVAWDWLGLRQSYERLAAEWRESKFKSLEFKAASLAGAGRLAEAEAEYKKALAEAITFGQNDRRVVEVLRLMRDVLQKQGRFLEMEQVSEQIAAIRKAHLAEVYGDLDSDIGKLEEVILTSVPRESVVRGGEETDETVDALASLARFCADQGDYRRAESLYKRALDLQRKAFGPRSPRACWLLGNLASLHLKQGQIDLAEPLLKEAAMLSEAVAGRNNPYTAVRWNEMGRMYTARGDLDRAEELHKRALDVIEHSSACGGDEETVCLRDYASVLRKKSRNAEAARLEERLRKLEARPKGGFAART